MNKWSPIYDHHKIVEFLGISIIGMYYLFIIIINSNFLITKYYFIDENQLYLIMPFANDDNLREYIKKNNALSFNKKIEIAKNITEGIKFLHENNIIHENLVSNLY